MADEVPETAGAATRNLLGAAGFILLLLGGEMIIEKTGERFWLGIGLIAGGIPIFFAGVFWKWLQRKLAAGISTRMNMVADDPRWWIGLLFSFMGASYAQLTYSSSHWDMGAASVGWIWVALVVLAVLYVLMTWRRIGIIGPHPSTASESSTSGQTRLDLIHLLDFAVNETTFWMLDRLIETADSPAVTDGFKDGHDTEEAHKSREWFVGYIRQELGYGTIRHSEYLSVMNGAQTEAERNLEATPQEQRPAGVDPLALRRHMISELQFRRSLQFLRNQKREVGERLVHQRHQLIERLEQRKKGTVG